METWGLLFYIYAIFSLPTMEVNKKMNIKKLKRICCRVVGVESFTEVVFRTLVGVGEFIFFAWMINDMINTLVSRGY